MLTLRPASASPTADELYADYVGINRQLTDSQTPEQSRAHLHVQAGNTALVLPGPVVARLLSRGDVACEPCRTPATAGLALAEDHFRWANLLSRDEGVPEVRADALLGLAAVALRRGEYPAAAQFAEEASQVRQTPEGQALLAFALARAGDGNRAEEVAVKLLEIAHSPGPLLLTGRGLAALPGRERRVEALAQMALKLSPNDPVVASTASELLGVAAEASGRRADALSHFRRAVAHAQRAQRQDLSYKSLHRMARLLLRDGKTADAAQAASLAVEDLQAIRSDLLAGGGNDPEPLEFTRDLRPVYEVAADSLLRLATETSTPSLLSDARAKLEQLKSADLDNFFGDACVTLLKSRSRRLDDLSPSTAVVYIIPLPERTDILLATRGGLERITCPPEATGPAVAEAALALRAALPDVSGNDFRAPARRLHRWLIDPIETRLESLGINTLVFVPDGPLRDAPMAALYGRGGFLGQRYAIAVSLGLELVDPRPFPRADASLLLCAMTREAEGFPALTSVPEEVSRVRDIFRSTVLVDDRFDATTLSANVRDKPFSIVHVASHASLGETASSTFILTGAGRLSLDALENSMRPSLFRDQPIELITLSACNTAASNDGRAALGLAGIAVRAGARSALASLWAVDDTATGLLVTRFYEILRDDPSASKAEALRRAQQHLIELGYEHPYYWGAFIIVGNWL